MSSAVTILPAGSGSSSDLRRFLALVRIAALRSLKVRYRGTFLGVLWSFGNPVMMTAVYTTLFGTAFSRFYDGSVLRYVVSVFIGLVVVTFFLNATGEALMSVVGNGSLLNKIAVRPAVFPLAAVAANVFQQALTTFPIVLLLSVFVTHDPVRIVLVPVMFVMLTLLTAGFSLMLAALYVFFRDLSYLWNVSGFILWLTSPMFYPESVVPDRIRFWFHVNPVSQQIIALREVAVGSGAIHWVLIGQAALSAVIACAVGAALFQTLRRDFMDLL